MTDSVKVWVRCPVCEGDGRCTILAGDVCDTSDCETCHGTGRIVGKVVDVEGLELIAGEITHVCVDAYCEDCEAVGDVEAYLEHRVQKVAEWMRVNVFGLDPKEACDAKDG